MLSVLGARPVTATALLLVKQSQFSSTAAAAAAAATPIKRIVVIGSGLMGSGIVQVAAANGLAVTMVDVKQDLLDKAKARIDSSLQVFIPPPVHA